MQQGLHLPGHNRPLPDQLSRGTAEAPRKVEAPLQQNSTVAPALDASMGSYQISDICDVQKAFNAWDDVPKEKTGYPNWWPDENGESCPQAGSYGKFYLTLQSDTQSTSSSKVRMCKSDNIQFDGKILLDERLPERGDYSKIFANLTVDVDMSGAVNGACQLVRIFIGDEHKDPMIETQSETFCGQDVKLIREAKCQ